MKRLRIGIVLIAVVLAVLPGMTNAARAQQPSLHPVPARVVFTQDNSLWMTTPNGKQLIVQGNTTTPFSWYQWSPDGKYLLVAQSDPSTQTSALVLYNAAGTRLRTLVSPLPWASYYPSWAANGDRAAYVAGSCKQEHINGCARSSDMTLFSVGVRGHRTFLGAYSVSGGGGCGGPIEDPAANLYKTETDFGITMPMLHWRIGPQPSFLGLAVYTVPASAGAMIAHPTTVPALYFAVSATRRVAGVIQTCGNNGCTSQVALFSPTTGRVLRTVGDGELPVFSRDGATLYFVRQAMQQTLNFQDSSGSAMPSQVNRSEIWRLGSGDAQPVMIFSEDAFGFGPPAMTPDGNAIIFSSVENDTTMWQHRLPGDRLDAQLIASYGPQVSVQSLNLATGTVQTLMQNAGRPAVQP